MAASGPTADLSAQGPTAPVAKAMTSAVAQQVIDQAQSMAVTRQGGAATLHLYPPDLGSIRLSVKVDGSSVSVHAVTGTQEVSEMLQSGMEHLRAGLQNAGMRFESFQVSVDPQGAQAQSNIT